MTSVKPDDLRFQSEAVQKQARKEKANKKDGIFRSS